MNFKAEINQNASVIEARHEADQPDENIKLFEVTPGAVTAVFWSIKDADDYWEKHCFVNNGVGIRHTTVGFADIEMQYGAKHITARSTYHGVSTLVEIFQKGLKV